MIDCNDDDFFPELEFIPTLYQKIDEKLDLNEDELALINAAENYDNY